MNTTQMSELYTLHNTVNNPPAYDYDDTKTEDATRMRLIPALVNWIVKSLRRGTARLPEASLSVGSADAS